MSDKDKDTMQGEDLISDQPGAGTPGGKAPRPLTDDRLWDADDVARFLNVSRSMVYKLEQAGELPCFHIGARIRFEPATVRGYARGELRGRPGGGVLLLDGRRPR